MIYSSADSLMFGPCGAENYYERHLLYLYSYIPPLVLSFEH